MIISILGKSGKKGKKKKPTHAVSIRVALLNSDKPKPLFKGSGELHISWVRTEHGY